MKLSGILVALIFCPVLVHAEIYKSVDADGHVTYSGTPSKGARRLDLPPIPTLQPPPRQSRPADFPKVDSKKQKERDALRRQILEDELAAEEKQLEIAQKNLAEASPEVFRGPDGKTYRNVAKYEEKTQELAKEVELHEKNISALKAELSKFQ